jgi:bifunctional DNA-binding transcriptional regulator/antitoxin component of YhaV-PrlF toxin-antitoxin module
MKDIEITRMGKRGTLVIPSRLRRRYKMEEGCIVIAEERREGVLLRPAAMLPIEIYSPERRAEFLLTSAADLRDYAKAVRAVKRMGLDPMSIPHVKPRR